MFRRERCEFCGERAGWVYRGVGSGDWLVCEHCRKLIDAEAVNPLIARASELLPRRDPQVWLRVLEGVIRDFMQKPRGTAERVKRTGLLARILRRLGINV